MVASAFASSPDCPENKSFYLYINGTYECYEQCPPNAPFRWLGGKECMLNCTGYYYTSMKPINGVIYYNCSDVMCDSWGHVIREDIDLGTHCCDNCPDDHHYVNTTKVKNWTQCVTRCDSGIY